MDLQAVWRVVLRRRRAEERFRGDGGAYGGVEVMGGRGQGDGGYSVGFSLSLDLSVFLPAFTASF